MNDPSFEEATQLLSSPNFCEDIEDWRPDKNQPTMSRCSGGLVDEYGARSGLVVELQFYDPPKTRLIEYKMTVFRLQFGSKQRVYQMHLNSLARTPKNWHDFAHEHMGKERIPGDSAWLGWTFQEALDYFCVRTKITFKPPVVDPSEFRLKP